MAFPFVRQHDIMDCGVACLKMVMQFYGSNYPMEYIREKTYINREGISLLAIRNAAEELGFKTVSAKCSVENLKESVVLPCIIHWNQTHYVVVYGIKHSKSEKKDYFRIADPSHGRVTIDEESFLRSWLPETHDKGIVLCMVPAGVAQAENGKFNRAGGGLKHSIKYLMEHKRYLFRLFTGMLAASLLTLVFPLLTQLLVDRGIGEANIKVIYLILISQFFVYLGAMAIEIIQNWLLLHVNIRISLSIVSDFLKKLLGLPISFFDSKAVGDITQRINDHYRIENFLTKTILAALFSFINLVMFSIVLTLYYWKVAVVFLILNTIGLLWVIRFQQKRKILDYIRFQRSRTIQDNLIEMIVGMQEIKLFGGENDRRRRWEKLQIKMFDLNTASLKLEQYQRVGFLSLSYLRYLLISFITAMAVVEGRLSLGVMLSISYILGQTNSPLEQIVGFFKSAQEAKLSMERMREIHDLRPEQDHPKKKCAQEGDFRGDIQLEGVSFRYGDASSASVLSKINLTIPHGKVTAIVGPSGGGKTTLVKLLLAFYEPLEGTIKIAGRSISSIPVMSWRSACGTVMQDGYIFSDSIERNIAVDGKKTDEQRMARALEVSNLLELVEALPLGLQTKIGANGLGLSGGQKQRILIARALYKSPDIFFLDEATSALDANNERSIVQKLAGVLENKTVVVIAHRLSTVKYADQIVVLNNGTISEIGTHDQLIRNRAYYYCLVKNQLEIDLGYENV
ncbi:peptidase domain-containing ABC transporter [Anditalea andensis]|uniref:ABC transporter ATP-binding protein n=1 Tax=Anditalea andensis TaxID=1048983 RepID=A0A074LGZ6_9BACT|nr:peptidase domain-containing ABC transporter [Anditalea andensis]KEO73052.1 hypothetical protein EL17_15690 [Anditalea andensis]